MLLYFGSMLSEAEYDRVPESGFTGIVRGRIDSFDLVVIGDVHNRAGSYKAHMFGTTSTSTPAPQYSH